jgi:hypothetical protein
VNFLWKALITLAALSLAATHVFLPSFQVDLILLMLLVLAGLPWFAKFIKAFEIPGVVKIDLAEAKAATDKITSVGVLAGKATLKLQGHGAMVQAEPAKPDPLEYHRKVFGSDPNLALVGFRIEIEQRINDLAMKFGVERNCGLQRAIQVLASTGVLPSAVASGLIELVALGNRAAHGAKVTPEAAEWVSDVGPSILIQLDEIIAKRSGTQ